MDVEKLIGETTDQNPRRGLRAVVALRRLASRLEATHVRRAREQGLSWAQIARELQVTRQSVHEKYAAENKDVRERKGL